MNVKKLHAITAQLIAKGQGNLDVCIRKDTFTHEDEAAGVNVMDVESAAVMQCDEIAADGKTASDSSILFVLKGEPSP